MFLAGLVTLCALRRIVTATTIALRWPEMIVLSTAKVYPFGDSRTSNFLIIITTMVAAVGVAGGCARLRRDVRIPLHEVAVMIAIALFALHAQPYLRSHLIPPTNVRDQIAYMRKQLQTNDVIVATMGATWNMADYRPTAKCTWKCTPSLCNSGTHTYEHPPEVWRHGL